MWHRSARTSTALSMGCVCLLVACATAPAAAPPPTLASFIWRPGFTTLRGFLARGDLYAVKTRVVPEVAYALLDIHIFRIPVTAKQSARASVRRSERTAHSPTCEPHGPLRWRIFAGTYWQDALGANGNITSFDLIRLEDLKHFDPDEKIELDFSDIKTLQKGFDHSWYLKPADSVIKAATTEEARGHHLETFFRPLPVEGVHFDLLPVGEKEGVLFVLHDKKMRVWRGVYTGEDSQPDGCNVKWTEAKADGFAAPLGEPFQVYGDRDNWQFLTRGGALYGSRKPAKGPRKLDLLYASRERPLRAVLTDSGTNKTFAFVAAPKSRKGEYFELSAGAKGAKPYTLPDAKLDAALDEPLRSLMGYARVLLADKQIEGKSPAKAGVKERSKSPTASTAGD